MESLFYDFAQQQCVAEADTNPNLVSENKTDLCGNTSSGEAWLQEKLERYWGAEKHHYIQHDAHFFDSSSTEQQLAFGDCLSQPPKPRERKARQSLQHSGSEIYFVVKGEDINDIPTKYVVNGLETHEFPVIGTYVDKRVISGFKYRVRINRTSKFLFDGKALVLQSIGRGYGKRLTFESDSYNYNDNYFYSDTIAPGYGFAPIAVEVGDAFQVRDPTSGEHCGQLEIVEMRRPQIEAETRIEDGEVEKVVEVDFFAKFTSVANSLLVNNAVPNWAKVRCAGTAYVKKAKRSRVAVLERIQLADCALAGYELLPVEQTLKSP